MHKKKIVLIFLVVCVVPALCFLLWRSPAKKISVAPPPAAKKIHLHATPVENPYLRQLLSAYEQTILDYLEKTHTPGVAIAIVRDTSVIYLRGFGVRMIGKKDSVDTETVFRLASVSKCFAPILTGMLVEDSVLSWDGKVVHYLPDFALSNKEQTAQLNLRHVLSHTVGLPYHTYTNLVEDGTDIETMLFKLREVNLINKVGTVYSYQNVAYSVIGEVIKKATGKSYEEMMISRIFTPLHMDQASISFDAIVHNDNVAFPHSHTRHGLSPMNISCTYYNVSPAGGINASISDMAKWMRALVGHHSGLISENTLNEIFTPVVKARSKNRNFYKWIRPTGSFYGMGWRILNFKTDTLFYHGGYVNGYRSEIALNRKDNIGVCVLANATGELIDNSVPSFFNLYLTYRDSIQHWDEHHRLMEQQQTQQPFALQP